MKCYGDWRVMVCDVIFRELRFLDRHTTLLSELNRKPDLVELAVNGNSPNGCVAQVWRVSR